MSDLLTDLQDSLCEVTETKYSPVVAEKLRAAMQAKGWVMFRGRRWWQFWRRA